MFKFKFGQGVKSMVDGQTGIVVQRSITTYSGVRYGIQVVPTHSSGDPKVWFIDEIELAECPEIEQPGSTLKELTKDPEFKFELGDRVGSVYTSFHGTVTAKMQYMNNCISYHVIHPELNPTTNKEVSTWCMGSELAAYTGKGFGKAHGTAPTKPAKTGCLRRTIGDQSCEMRDINISHLTYILNFVFYGDTK